MSTTNKEPSYLKKEITDEDVKIFEKLFEGLEKDKQTSEFLEPVDYVKLNILDYPSIITKPMDLGTAKKKLLNGEYKLFEDFLNDINLIWDNCRIYNLPGSEIVKMANHCEKTFKKLMDKYFKNYQSKPKNINNNNNEIIKLTTAEKNNLVEKIREQSNENLTQIVKLLLKVSPKAIEDVDSEKLHIKLDFLDHKAYELVMNLMDISSNNNIVKAIPVKK